jgi:putative FmdB family regulatory protein
MPTYDYRCAACEHEFEAYQSITAKALKKCPSCSKPKLQRLIGTGGGIIFKGDGFYQTDYRSESYRKGAEAEKKAAGGDQKDKGKSESSDAKPAETTDKPKKSSDTGDQKAPKAATTAA